MTTTRGQYNLKPGDKPDAQARDSVSAYPCLRVGLVSELTNEPPVVSQFGVSAVEALMRGAALDVPVPSALLHLEGGGHGA